MSRNRLPYIIGALGVAAGGVYLYRAGGDTKLARQKMESDAHRASLDVKSHLPGRRDREPTAEEKLAGSGARAGAEVDKAAEEVAEKARKSREELAKGIDKFDEKVSEGSSKAKSSVSGWFGGGGNK